MGRFGGRFDERPGAEDTSAEAKRDRVLAHFPPAMVPRAMALITPAQPGRDRCRFSFLADAATGRVALSFAERGAGAAPVDGHALASRRVNDLLPLIVAAANARAPLRANLRAAHVHAPRWAGAEPVVALVYEGPPAGEAAWLAAADALRADCAAAAVGPRGAGEVVHVVGRFKGRALLSGTNDFVVDALDLADGRRPRYEFPEGSFSHPCGSANERSLDWLVARVDDIRASLGRAPNLLELYCGCGNHTVALAPATGRTVAVEVDARLTAAAERNLDRNGVANATILTDTVGASRGVHRALRAKRSGDVCFDLLLVDPPRRGLDAATRKCLAAYDHVLFVSCNPAALAEDLEALEPTHAVAAAAVVDGFPGTPHCECLVHFARRPPPRPSSVAFAAPVHQPRSLRDTALAVLSDNARDLGTDAVDALDVAAASDLLRWIVSKQKLTTSIALVFMRSRHTDIAAALGHLDLVAGVDTYGPGYVPSGGRAF